MALVVRTIIDGKAKYRNNKTGNLFDTPEEAEKDGVKKAKKQDKDERTKSVY